MTEEIVAFKGELMLLNWNESKQGRTAVFLMDEESPEHPMKRFTTKKGKRAGQRFMCVLVELNDDDTPVIQEKKGGPLSKSAAQMCENPMFQAFAKDRYDLVWPAGIPQLHANGAAIVVRAVCNVASRSELDHNPEAAKRFHELMREYREWSCQ